MATTRIQLVGPIPKSQVGLGNVDNTADTEKPVSNPQRAELLAKSGGTMTGALTTNGIILTQGADFGETLPDNAPEGRLFFLKAQQA